MDHLAASEVGDSGTTASEFLSDAPYDAVAQQALKWLCLPWATKQSWGAPRRMHAGVHNGLPIICWGVTVAKRDIGHAALAKLTGVPEHARLAIRQEGGVFVVDEAEARG